MCTYHKQSRKPPHCTQDCEGCIWNEGNLSKEDEEVYKKFEQAIQNMYTPTGLTVDDIMIKSSDRKAGRTLVEVVYCKDRKWQDEHHGCGRNNIWGPDDFYCALGERKQL